MKMSPYLLLDDGREKNLTHLLAMQLKDDKQNGWETELLFLFVKTVNYRTHKRLAALQSQL